MSNDAQQPVNPFTAHQQLLRERFHLLLATLHPVLQMDVERVLKVRGKLLFESPISMDDAISGRPAGSWSLLTYLLALHFSPRLNPAIASSVAIATECFVCALDLLDDVEDEDHTPVIKELGIPRVLNTSTALLALAQQAFFSLVRLGSDQVLVLRLLDSMHEALLVATAGQHRDLLAEQRNACDLTREECIEIAAAKAGAIMRLACLLGALGAHASEAECAEWAEIGNLLGIAHQLDNDSHDLYYLIESIDAPAAIAAEKTMKTDVTRGKKTLPVVLAARVSLPFQDSKEMSDDKPQERLSALREGIMTTWVLSLLYRERANDRLRAISSRKPLAPELHLLLGFE